MNYAFGFHPYRRQFLQPLSTHHGVWSVREGLIVTLTDELGQMGQGEIAPLPAFGSESLVMAHEYCRQLPHQLTAAEIGQVPSVLPACQFGLGTAWENLPLGSGQIPHNLLLCGLLPTGVAALKKWPQLWQQGYRTLKWKIGVAAAATEMALFQTLMAVLPANLYLRLDANGGLDLPTARAWLALGDAWKDDRNPHATLEYLEQPLPVDQLDAMIGLAQTYQTPLALDESVANLVRLQDCCDRGWAGIVIIKPAIFGYPQHLRAFCQSQNLDIVFSSVFETEVGRQACLQLAQELATGDRALGFGIGHWFSDHADCENSV